MTQNHDGVVRTKFSAPALPHGLVTRERLHTRLESHPARLVLVSAPAGFGKTALVLDWLARRAGAWAWLSIDRGDNDPARFFNHLAAALALLPHEGAANAAALVRTLALRSGAASDAQDAFAALGSGVVLVLDDAHELDDPRVLAGLEQLLAVRPPAPRVVLVTRVDPPLPLGRLRVSGELLELRERDLRFTRDECAALFDGLLPGGLEVPLLEALEARTEGWVAGLRLAAIALQDVAAPAAAVAAFAGSHRLVVDYLVEEALERQSETVQQFLLDTSVLDRFTAETCAAVTGQPDAARLLAEVEAANLFVVPLGHERRWYRYHHLFRELLEFRLRRLQPTHVDELHARAARWFAEAGDLHAAIEHAAQLEDRTLLLEQLDAYAFDILRRSELATLQRWIRRIPDPLTYPYPLLIVALGWLRVLTQRAPDLAPVFEAADRALERTPTGYDERRKWRARTSLNVLHGFAARFASRFEEALLISRAALQDLSEEEPFTRGLVLFNMGRLEMLVGSMAPALELLERSFNDNVRADNDYVVLVGLGQAAAVHAQLSGLQRARAELKASMAFAEQRHLDGLPAFSAVLYHLAHVEYLADQLDAAQELAERAVALSRAGFPEGHGNGLLLLFRVACARGDLDEAEALLTELAALARDSNLVLLDTTVLLEQARLALIREQRGAGPPAAFPPLTDTADCWSTFRETETLLRLQQALRRQDHACAEALAVLLEHESRSRGRGLTLCLALLAQALEPGTQDRWERLEAALHLSATRGYVGPLLDFGEPLRAVLNAALTHPLSASARQQARVLLDRMDSTATAALPTPPPPLPEPLTAREQDVLRHLVANLSNKAMARAMYVSPETVKTHLKHLYWKLGVSSREGAVERARELGILPHLHA